MAFRAPMMSLGNLDAETAASLITAAADIALVVDDRGIVRDMAFHDEQLAHDLQGENSWLGAVWIDTVSPDSRRKVELLLREADTRDEPKWRHLNHPKPDGADIPVLYSAVRIGEDGRVVVFGRDLRAVSDLQQRLVSAQQSMERDYSRTRQVETRYRLLFQKSTEAIFILEAGSQRLVEANPATLALASEAGRRRGVTSMADIFSRETLPAVEALLANVRASGRPDDVRARVVEQEQEVMVSASLFREDQMGLFLVRVAVLQADGTGEGMPKLKSKLLKLVESAPDGFVVTGADGRIITANAAFVDMAQLSNEGMALGESLERWLGRPGVDLDVLTANLREHGSVRLFATTLRGEFGAPEEVEVSAVSVMNGGRPCFGFSIRSVGRRIVAAEAGGTQPLPRSVQQLTELIGRVALKDLVREATDVIERLCIETALELTRDNRASAAEMLGLSRQSLYVKLRRYGLGDLAAEGTS